MTFEEMAKARYSVKNFADRPVEEEKLQKILEVACLAPTAKNSQPFRIYVLKSEDAMNKMRELTPCVYGAPVALMLTYNTDEVFQYPKEDGVNSGNEDCSIVATHVMFEALEQGLGTCWVNAFSPTEAKKIFGLPENEKVVLLMPIGYPDAEPKPTHAAQRPMSEVIIEK